MTAWLGDLGRMLPRPARRLASSVRYSRRLRRLVRPVRWGNLRRLEPISPGWGSERGTSVDRHYIDRFFAEQAHLIRGRVLEVGSARYATQFGIGVDGLEIVDIDPRNEEATIIADLADEGSLPAAAFDCAIVPQTLFLVRDPFVAVENLWQALRPNGALLVTTPAISKVAHDFPDHDRWHLTVPGLREVLSRSCPGGEPDVEGHGNPIVAVAFLHGIVQEDLRPGDLDAAHPLYPIVTTGVVRKPAPPVTAAVVLTFHRIAEGPDPLLQCVTPGRFRDQLRALADIAAVVPLQALDRPGGRPRVAITFDDGYADNAATAAPILREAGTPATFFVPSRVVDDTAEHWWDVVEHLHDDEPVVEAVELVAGGRSVRVDVRSPAGRERSLKVVTRRLRARPMTEIGPAVAAVARQLGGDPQPRCGRHALMTGDDVAALAADPLFEIGSHGITHTMLSALTRAGQAEELVASRRRLAEVAGRPITSLAYPYGTPDSFTDETVREVRRAGYEWACVNTPGLVTRRRRLTCPRHMVYDWTGEELARNVSSWLAA